MLHRRIVIAGFSIAVAGLAFAVFDARAIPAINGLASRLLGRGPTPENFAGGNPVAVREVPPQAFCSSRNLSEPAFHSPFEGTYWNGWGGDLGNRRSQSAGQAGLRNDQVARLTLKWAFGVLGAVELAAQPTVAGGRLFFGSGAGKVYSISAESGCIYWIFDAGTRVRTAITLGAIGEGWAAYFGDAEGNGAHAYAVDAATGRLIWKTTVDESQYGRVSGAPVLASGKLFVPVTGGEDALAGNPQLECCHFQGALAALDSITGSIVWKTSTIAQPSRPFRKNSQGVQQWGPSGAGIWTAPTLDLVRRAIYVGTGDSHSDPAAATSDAILAFDMDTGAMLWSRQMTAGDAWNIACVDGDPANCPEAAGSDLDFAAPPILVDLRNGRRALIAAQKTGIVYSIDPDSRGKEIWRARIGKGGVAGGIMAGSSVDEANVYLALADISDPFLRAPIREDPWQRRLSYEFRWLWNLGMLRLRSREAGGGTFALRLETGEKVWYSPPQCETSTRCRPGQLGAVTGIPGVVFSGTADGHLRAYSADDGTVRWSVATMQGYEAVNGVIAHGGLISRSGAVIAGGVVYLNVGNSDRSDPVGNVLLAFSVDAK